MYLNEFIVQKTPQKNLQSCQCNLKCENVYSNGVCLGPVTPPVEIVISGIPRLGGPGKKPIKAPVGDYTYIQ